MGFADRRRKSLTSSRWTRTALTPGFDVLCLAPENGRLADLGYVLSLTLNGPSLLYDGLALARTNTVTASHNGGGR